MADHFRIAGETLTGREEGGNLRLKMTSSERITPPRPGMIGAAIPVKDRRKIILFYTMSSPDYWETVKILPIGFPIGVVYIASVLKQAGYHPVIIDATVERDYQKRLERELDGTVLYVGISTMTAGVFQGIEISALVRETLPDVPIVWGGVHSTIFPLETLEDTLVDFVCIGEGERVALALAERLRTDGIFAGLPGLGYKEAGIPRINSGFDHIAAGDLPSVDYSVVDMEKYLVRRTTSFTGEKEPQRVLSLHGGRGCTYKCTFCITTLDAWAGRRDKKSDQLIFEIEDAIKRFGIEVFHFQDENFFSSRKRTLDFFAGCRARNLEFRWFASTHSDYFNDAYLNEEFFRLYCIGPMRCINFQIGVESASTRMQKFIKKMAHLDRVRHAASLSKKFGVLMAFSFMVGIPTETREEMMRTVQFMLELRSISPLVFTTYQFYRPYPGSELYKLAVEMGYRSPRTLREWAAHVKSETGFLPAGDLPWIENTDFLRKMIWCMTILNVPEGLLPKSYLPFYRMARRWILFRIRHDFWHLPLDFAILEKRFWKKGILSIDNA
jgi:radical SAM superfamily enzyme YgiQ (UPF0313 family)